MGNKKSRRWLALVPLLLLGVAVLFLGQPGCLWFMAWLRDKPAPDVPEPGFVNDASRLNRTHVSEVWSVPSDPEFAESQLRALLHRAHADHRTVAIAGARHSMGGHTISADGIALDMQPFNHMELDAGCRILRVGAGARWSEIIPYLDARGFAVAVMQSNNNFTVGGSLSVNCHGWQPNRPPIGSTVESLRLMKADGAVVRCSRTENAELFSLVLGGYGLFGMILDVELCVVPNERYRAEVEVVASDRYVGAFAEKVTGRTDAGLVYGRLCVVPGPKTFLRDAIMTVFRQAPGKAEEMPALKSPGYTTLRREVYRAQIGNDAGKEERWKLEKSLGNVVARHYFSRNQLLNEPVEVYQERNADRTDILHEYFVPPDRFEAFLERARAIIPRYPVDLMNVTIRNVLEDRDVFLRYADRDLFAFVMLFNQPRTQEADQHMEVCTRELIDAALECGGRYYLPYRLHATPAQLARAYPQAAAFFKRKRYYDRDEIFQNQFYTKYGRP
jgi:FAD/FMN-containing dehydrogenase